MMVSSHQLSPDVLNIAVHAVNNKILALISR